MTNSIAARRPARVLVFVLAGTILFSGVQASPASAALTSPEKKLVNLINKARTTRGKSKLKVNGVLSKYARKHATAMMNQNKPLMHSSTNQLLKYMGQAGCVARIGENVGAASTVTEMHQAYMASPPHRENILAGYWKKVGVGIRKSGGRMWTTELFCV